MSRSSTPAGLLGALSGLLSLSVVAALLLVAGVTPVVAAAGAGARATVAVFSDLPDFIEIGTLSQRNVLFAARDGRQVPFATLYDQNRVILPADKISQTLKDAAVAGEDHRYFEHDGVDFLSVGRAVIDSINGGFGSGGGGSTLTMQLVRNILVTRATELEGPDTRAAALRQATRESAGRKLTEMKFALALEKRYSKSEILAAYLNIAYFGSGAYGVEAASQFYYGKGGHDLTVAEAASLVAIVQSPDERNLAAASHYPANKARRDVILSALRADGMIDDAATTAAIATPVVDYVHVTPPTQGCLAVTEPGAAQWCDLISRVAPTLPALGATTKERSATWRAGGLEIHTTLDLDLTATAKRQLTTYAPNTESRYDLGGVVTSVEAATGRVIALTQNKEFDNTAVGRGSAATSVNYAVDESLGSSGGFQPGSTYKPFTLLEWLKTGHRLSESVDATPRTFSPMTVCGARETNRFAPRNDDGGNPGRVTAERATIRSINTAYVAMAQQLDLCKIRDTAASLGVHPARGGQLSAVPASVLGAGDTVAPLTMAAAFAALANGGVACSPVFVDSITMPDGRSTRGQSGDCHRAVDSTVAAEATSALQKVFTAGTATAGNPRDGVPIMGKTGTTDGAEQTWLVGGSTRVVTAAWVGNVSGHQNQYRIRGAHGAMNVQRFTIWKNVTREVNKKMPGTAFASVPSSALSDPRPTVPGTSPPRPSATTPPTVPATSTPAPVPSPTGPVGEE